MTKTDPALIRAVRAHMRQLTGRDYNIALEQLDVQSLVAMQRFLQDAESEARNRARRAQMQPWRQP